MRRNFKSLVLAGAVMASAAAMSHAAVILSFGTPASTPPGVGLNGASGGFSRGQVEGTPGYVTLTDTDADGQGYVDGSTKVPTGSSSAFFGIDPNTSSLQLTVRKNSIADTQTKMIVKLTAPSGDQSYTFNFTPATNTTDFQTYTATKTLAAGGSKITDFTTVNRIDIQGSYVSGEVADIQIRSLTVIPEPAALGSVGILGTLLLRRRSH